MYVVDGFEFQTKEEARQAKKESDGIRYIKDQTDMSDPDTVYKLYLRLNKPGYFFTPVGLSFLVELQEYLHTIPYIKNEDIRPIYIPEDKKAVVEVKKQTEGYKKKFHVALFFYYCIIGCHSNYVWHHICEWTQSVCGGLRE